MREHREWSKRRKHEPAAVHPQSPLHTRTRARLRPKRRPFLIMRSSGPAGKCLPVDQWQAQRAKL
jgi:hypothetical protein